MYKKFILPIIDTLDAETEHLVIRELLHFLELSPNCKELIEQLTYKKKRFTDPRLNVTIGGIKLDNPLIVGAGWDKESRAVKALYQLGFSAIEVGTILTNPQEGNPKPRHFMLAAGVPLNRYGFNTIGMDDFAKNVETYREMNIPMGINVSKNKDIEQIDAPYAFSDVVKKFYHDGDYFVINVSSPNTPGLRQLQDKEPLTKIVQAVNETMDEKTGRKPVFVKIAPDITYEAVNDVIEVVMHNQLTGIIATNTTLNADIKETYGEQWRNEMGGVSGDDEDFRKMSTNIVKHIYKEAGNKITIIGVGGIKDSKTALEKIKAGATALQIVSALDEEGPHLPGIINRGIVDYMDKEGVKHISELVGVTA